MKITEGLMTGTEFFGEPTCQAYIASSLQVVLATKIKYGAISTITQFPGVYGSPWRSNTSSSKFIINNHSPVRHKIFDSGELDFLREYDNLGELSLDTLVYLADPHDRCTFEVKSEQFISLFSQLETLAKEYKYSSNIYNTEIDYRRLVSNYTLGISFYKMNTFLYDVYGNKPTGLGIAFEIFNKSRSCDLPSTSVGFYLLLTDVYDGVFYLDGNERYPLKDTNFGEKARYLQSILELAKSPVRVASPKQNRGTEVFEEYLSKRHQKSRNDGPKPSFFASNKTNSSKIPVDNLESFTAIRGYMYKSTDPVKTTRSAAKKIHNIRYYADLYGAAVTRDDALDYNPFAKKVEQPLYEAPTRVREKLLTKKEKLPTQKVAKSRGISNIPEDEVFWDEEYNSEPRKIYKSWSEVIQTNSSDTEISNIALDDTDF